MSSLAKVLAGTSICPVSDAALLGSSQNGCIDSFETLLLRYRPSITSKAKRFLIPMGDFDDIFQEVSVRAYRYLHRVQNGAPFDRWIHAIATNVCRDWHRRKRRCLETPISQLGRHETATLFDYHTRQQSETNARQLDNGLEARALIGNLLHRLTSADQELLRLLYIEEKSTAEVAVITGLSRSNVKVRALRAKRALRKELDLLPPRRPLNTNVDPGPPANIADIA